MAIKRLSFDCVPHTHGYIQSNNIELIIEGNIEPVKEYLTCYNESVQWQLNMLLKQRAFSDVLREAERQAQISKLKEEVKHEFFAETVLNIDDVLSVPAGFWYLCQNVQNNAHLNTDMTPIVPKYLREYQKDCLLTMLKYKRASCSLATGLGKTVLVSAIVHSAIFAGKRTMIIVPTIDLIKQTIASFKNLGIENICGVGGVYQFKHGCDCCITTMDSCIKYIEIFDVVVMDESHHSSAKTIQNALISAVNATHVYGVSATPYRTDGMDLGVHSFTGPIVYEKTAKWGIENGWLTEPKIFMAKIRKLPWCNSKMLRAYAYGKLAAHNLTFKYILKNTLKALEAKRTVVIIFTTVKAGQKFQKYCEKVLKFSVAHAKYRVPFDQFVKGETNLLVGNVKLFGEGVDIPRISCIITVCNNTSEIMTRQVLGRAMRIAEGKKDAIVLDIGLSGYEPFDKAFEYRKQTYLTVVDVVKEMDVE